MTATLANTTMAPAPTTAEPQLLAVSVIVCTRNRVDQLPPSLASIEVAAAQAGLLERLEIVLVDNGSTDATAQTVADFAVTSRVPVRYIYEGRPGLSIARNTGLAAARGAHIVFTDDDCRLQPDYLQVLLAIDSAEPNAVLRGGRVELGDPRDLACTILPSREFRRIGVHAPIEGHLGGLLIGCNLAMRREVVDRLGPFDELFGAGGPLKAAEDSDYMFRAYLAGLAIEYCPDLVVYHHHGRRAADSINKLLINYDEGEGAIYIKFLFKDWRLTRQFYWDCKSSIAEILGRKYTNLRFGVTHRQKVYRNVIGALRYIGLTWFPRAAKT